MPPPSDLHRSCTAQLRSARQALSGRSGSLRPLNAWLCIGLGGFCLSWASIFVKWCDLPPVTVAAWRLTLASLFLLCWPTSRRLSGPLPWPLVLVGGSLLALHFVTWLASLKLLPVYLSVTLVTTSPLWVALGSRWLFEERLNILPLSLALVGTLLLSTGSAPAGEVHSWSGVLLALTGAWSMSAYLLWARAHPQSAGTLSYALRVYAVAALLLIALATLTGKPLWGFEPRQWLWLGMLALIPQVFGHTLLLLAVRYGSANSAAQSILLEPVGSMALAVWLLQERLSLQEAVGAFLILIGLAGLLRAPRQGRS